MRQISLRQDGPRWPRWIELTTNGVGLSYRAKWWRLLDLASLDSSGRPIVFGSRFQQRDFAIDSASEEWAAEQARRAEAALPLGCRPGFLAIVDGLVIAGGRVVSDAERAARKALEARSGRRCRRRIEIAHATRGAMAAWVAEGSEARIELRTISPHWSGRAALTAEEAATFTAAFSEMVGWCAHGWTSIEAFAADEAQADWRGRKAVWRKYRDTGHNLETCEVTAAGMVLLERGRNLEALWVYDVIPGEYREYEFIEGQIYLQHVPGAPITAAIACAADEAKAMHEIEKLIPEQTDDPCAIRVRCY